MKIVLLAWLSIAPLFGQYVASASFNIGATSVSIPNTSSILLGSLCVDSTGSQLLTSAPTQTNPSILSFGVATSNSGTCTIFGFGGGGSGGGGSGVPGPTAVDWISQIKNKPFVEVRSYAFTAQRPGGTLTASSPASVRLSPCPVGVNGTDVNHYVRISGGTGTAEAVLITGGSCSSGIATGTITFTPANNHSGAWMVGPANSGIQEAINSATSGSVVYLPPAIYTVYAPIYVSKSLTFQGSGISGTIVQGQSAGVGIFNAVASAAWKDLQISSLVQQTSGAYGVRLSALGSASNSFSSFDHMYFGKLYDAVLAVNAGQFTVTNSFFVDFAHTGITAADANSPDYGGPTVTGNNFSNFNISPAADAALLITSTGDITFANNGVNGSATQLDFGIHLNSTVSSGLLVDNNDFENLALSGIRLEGTFEIVNISNNHFAQFGGIGNPNTYWGIDILDGSGTGIAYGTITGNVLLGLGPSSSNNGIAVEGHANQWYVSGNTLNGFGQGLFSGSTTSVVTLGQNNVANGGTTVADITAFSNTIVTFATPVSFSHLNNWANGSIIYCTDCNTGCTAGASNGQICKRINGAWTN